MVCVRFLTPPEGTVLGFSLQGHAGCGEAGQDIVCAAVSSAAYLTVNTLTDVCRVTPLSLRVGEGEMFFRIEVRDEGTGIEEGEENLIFRRFYRGKRVNGQNGFGLGLYLSREIVQRHGGFMKVKRLEPGLSVGIYLPVE